MYLKQIFQTRLNTFKQNKIIMDFFVFTLKITTIIAKCSMFWGFRNEYKILDIYNNERGKIFAIKTDLF